MKEERRTPSYLARLAGKLTARALSKNIKPGLSDNSNYGEELAQIMRLG
ncbi:hypothetical protein PY364_28520 [Kamptonema sp. UHCC 0994]|nr:hypothetical protein [Kamptonema sp. UHCC 0994]